MAEVLHGYSLLKKLSENNLTNSYHAINKNSNKPCFVKSINLDSTSISLEEKKNIIRASFKLQKHLNSTYILTARDIYENNNQLTVEYEYLSPERYHLLTEAYFSKNKKELIEQICFLIDLLHVNGIIHTDIKLSNFLFDTKRKKLILIDLDLIANQNSTPRGFIRGTKHHISPKIKNNNIIDRTVDYYSFGVLLEKALMDISTYGTFINQLKDLSAVHPFNTLGDGLYKNALLSQESYQEYMKNLFGSYIINTLPAHKRKRQYQTRNVFATPNNVIGIHKDILLLIEEAVKSKTKQFKYIKALIKESKITYYGFLWFFQVPKDAYLKIFNSARDLSISDDIMLYKKLLDKKSYYLAYIFGATLFDVESNKTQKSQEILSQMIQLAFSFGDFDHCLKLIDAYQLAHLNQTDFIERIKINCLISKNRIDEVANILRENSLIHPRDNYNYLAFISMRAGETEKAEANLKYAEQTSSDNSYLQCKTKYYSLLLQAYKGNFEQAIAIGQTIEEQFSSEETKSLYVATLSMIANLAYEIGDYNKAIKYGKKGLDFSNSLETFDKAGIFHTALSNAYLRKSKFKKSLEHLLCSIGMIKAEVNTNSSILQLLTYCSYLLRTGLYSKAIAILQSITNIEDVKISRNIGKAYQNLIETAWFSGQTELLKLAYKKAKDIFSQLNDKTSLEEVKSLYICYETLENNSNSIEQLDETMTSLIKKKSLYCAFRVLFIRCLISLKERVDLPANLIESSDKSIQQSPFLNMVFKTYLKIRAHPKKETTVTILKKLIPGLRSQKEYYYYSLVLELIGDEYFNNKDHDLARKYYAIALESYEQIHNLSKVNIISNKIDTLPVQNEYADNAKVIEEITELLTSIDNLYDCYTNVLQFALKLTKAERAVLLVQGVDDSSLHVKASLNCDQESINEIEVYSSTLTNQAFIDNESFVVDNALHDKRFAQYKSIIKHNILSVLAIPLHKGEKVLGVLYLDHHIIPALFSEEDVIFTRTIANLLSMVISTSSIMQNYQIKNKELLESMQATHGKQKFITRHTEMMRLFDQLPRFAQSKASVLLLGESGTGKEIIAQMIHDLSNRKNKPLIKINAAAIPEKLIEAELFGIADKVATDVKGRIGKFEAADGTTLFIDEIGDLPLEIQAKILRAIEYQEFERIGNKKTIRTDIRFIYATNKNLQEMVDQKLFREDLYYRINTLPIHLSPLREREGDIPLLIQEFLKRYSQDDHPISIAPDVLSLLEAYEWPGNVRELKNTIERLTLYSTDFTISLSNLPGDLRDKLLQNTSLDPKSLEKNRIIEALKRNNGIQSKAAKELKIPLTSFRRKLELYKIN